jgi:hypothetical protein
MMVGASIGAVLLPGAGAYLAACKSLVPGGSWETRGK